MAQPIAITVKQGNEDLVFKLIPTGSMDDFLADVETIETVQDVYDGEEAFNLWKIA